MSGIDMDPQVDDQPQSTFASVKKHAAAVSGLLTFVTIMVGAVLSVESRYAKAEDLQPIKELSTQTINQMRMEQKQAIIGLRTQQIEDKLFELRLKQQQTNIDKALIQRYEDQLKIIQIQK